MTTFADQPATHPQDSIDRASIELRPPVPAAVRRRPRSAGSGRARKAESAPDSVRRYLDSISRAELLDVETEAELAQDIEAGVYAQHLLDDGVAHLVEDLQRIAARGEKAFEAMVIANLRLVVYHARGRQHRGVDLEDLISEGNFGLRHAVRKYDHRQGNKFSTYASWWIIQAMERAVANQGRLIRLPVHQVELSSQIRASGQRLGVNPFLKSGAESIAADLGSDEQSVALLLRMDQPVHSLDYEVPDGRGGMEPVGWQVEDTDIEPVDSRLLAQAERDDALALLDLLDERSAGMLRMRFGFEDGTAHTLESVGQRYGVTRERVRQLEKAGLAALRDHLGVGSPVKDS